MVHPVSGNGPAYNPISPGSSPAVKNAVKDLNQMLSDYTNVHPPIINDKYVGRITNDLQIIANAYQSESGNTQAASITGQCNAALGYLNGYDQNSDDAPRLSSMLINTIQFILGDITGT